MNRKHSPEVKSKDAGVTRREPNETSVQDESLRVSTNISLTTRKRKDDFGGKLPVTTETLRSLGLSLQFGPHQPEEDPPPPPGAPAKSSRNSGKEGKKTLVIPPGLPRREISLPANDNCECGSRYRVISEAPTEKIGIIPAQIIVEQHYNNAKECRRCNETVRHRVKNGATQGWKYGTSFLVETIVRRFAEFIPYNRQSLMNAHSGMYVHRSTMSKQVIASTPSIEPVFDERVKYTLSSYMVMLDETAIQLLGSPKLAWCWAAMTDRRRYDPSSFPAVVMRFATSRKSEVILDFMKKSTASVILVDGYTGYNVLLNPEKRQFPVGRGFCNAHARRGFHNALDAGEDPTGFAAELVIDYARVYSIERSLFGLSPEERVLGRRRCGTIMNQMRHKMNIHINGEDGNGGASKKSKLGAAIQYFLKHFDGLTLFLEDGRVEIDNNLIENQMRPIATLRNACRFTASELGGKSWMIYASLMATCRLNGINPRIYLNWVFEHIANKHPLSRMSELLPWHCHQARHGQLIAAPSEPWEKKARRSVARAQSKAA